MMNLRTRNKVACALVAVLAMCAGSPAFASGPARVGMPAPHFVIDGVDAAKISLATHLGRPVFLNFFATWCPPCKLELPFIVAQYPAYENRVDFVGIDEQEEPAPVKAFAKRMKIAYAVGIDQGNVAADYLVGAIPVSVFIDKSGTIRAINRGYLTPTILKQDLALITR